MMMIKLKKNSRPLGVENECLQLKKKKQTSKGIDLHNIFLFNVVGLSYCNDPMKWRQVRDDKKDLLPVLELQCLAIHITGTGQEKLHNSDDFPFFFSSMGLRRLSGNTKPLHQQAVDLHGAEKKYFSLQRTKMEDAMGQWYNYHQPRCPFHITLIFLKDGLLCSKTRD